MSYTPTSPPAIAIAQLRRMVSLSATFQAGMAVASATLALPFILMGRQAYANLPSGGGLIYLAETPADFPLSSGGDQLHLTVTGKLILQLIYPLSSSDSATDRYLKGVDFVANVATDVKALSGAEDTGTAFGQNHLDITHISAEYMAPGNVQYDASRGLLFLAKLHVDWGIA